MAPSTDRRSFDDAEGVPLWGRLAVAAPPPAPAVPRHPVAAGFVADAHEVGVPVPAVPAPVVDDLDTVGPGVVARTLGVSHSTVRRLIEDGQLDATRTPGGHRRVRRSELRRVASALTGPGRVRAADLPGHGLPVLAAVLEHHGPALAHAAARGTYVPGSPGWFAEPAAARPFRAWASTASRAIAGGRATDAVAASRLLFEAARDVAGLEECLVFADRLSALVLRRLVAEPGGADEIDDARTILAAMRRSLAVLEDARTQARRSVPAVAGSSRVAARR